MKYIKKFENKYDVGDYVIPEGDNKKDSYTIIVSAHGGRMPYMLHTYNIHTGKQLEQFPVNDSEIVRKLTEEEIDYIDSMRDANKYNL